MDKNNFLNLRYELHQNLFMLTFDKYLTKYKKFVHFDFNENMFLKPNQNAFEFVTHLLFGCLDYDECQIRFRGCFPCLDHSQSNDFRRVAHEWLQEINTSLGIPQISPIHTVKPGGEGFCIVYLAFSNYVLASMSNRWSESIIPSINDITCSNTNELEGKLDCLLKHELELSEKRGSWDNKASKFLENEVKLTKQKEEIEMIQQNLKKELGRILNEESFDQLTEVYATLVKSARSLWEELKVLNKTLELHWELLETILKAPKSVNKYDFKQQSKLQYFCSTEGQLNIRLLIEKQKSIFIEFREFLSEVSMTDLEKLNGKAGILQEDHLKQRHEIQSVCKKLYFLKTELQFETESLRTKLLNHPDIMKVRNFYRNELFSNGLTCMFEAKSVKREFEPRLNTEINQRLNEELSNKALTPETNYENSAYLSLFEISTARYIPPAEASTCLFLSPVHEISSNNQSLDLSHPTHCSPNTTKFSDKQRNSNASNVSELSLLMEEVPDILYDSD